MIYHVHNLIYKATLKYNFDLDVVSMNVLCYTSTQHIEALLLALPLPDVKDYLRRNLSSDPP